MPTRLRERSKPATIRDLVADDARVVALEGFTPWMGATIERGRYFTLDAPVVRAHPMFFAVLVPAVDVLAGDIERGG